MNSSNTPVLPVIVIGGGPVGLGAAVELARCQIPSILIERNDRTSWHPKTRNFNTRTMEIARLWGREIYDELRELDLPIQWKSPIRFSGSIVGEETGHIESKGFIGAGPELSPVSSVLSSQDMIEPVLLRQAKRSGLVDVRFGHEMVEFISGHDGDATSVEIRVRNKVTGEESVLRGSALVAADGAGSGMRSLLKMPMHGTAKIAHFINCYFKADLERYASNRPGILLFIGNEKATGVFQPLDARGRWLCQISVPEDQWSTDVFTQERCVQWVRDASGVDDLDVQVQSVGKWQMNALVAENFVVGRVLLMGDAAHMFPPTGGLGVNTGMQGMHNAIWKLALYLRGKAGRSLLETYTTERRPYARWVAEQSFHNSRQVTKMRLISVGKAPADMSAEEVLKETRRYGNQLGLELGSCYESSAVIPDGSAPPEVRDAYVDYIQTGRPGHRAPHVWLQKSDDSFSTLDLFGSEFTVLAGCKGAPWQPEVEKLAKATGLNIGFHVIDSPNLKDKEGTFLQRYGIEADGAVLVRPDGWVAWRSSHFSPEAATQLTEGLKRILK
jgi:putative polyketide hydroxylase